ncbi:transposase, partial [Alicyclobacillus fastidiosus]
MTKQAHFRRQFSYEYKLEIVEKHMLDGIPIKVLASEYELHPRLIMKWWIVNTKLNNFFKVGRFVF